MSVTAAEGFRAAGIAAGIKGSGDPDLALVATEDGAPVPAAGVFTTNRMTAAPVLITQGNLQAAGGHAAAVVLNSGNANAGTGEAGERDAEAMCDAVAAELGCDRHHVGVCSTGLIGFPLPVERIVDAVPGLVGALAADGGGAAAEAIRTTDTHRKEVVVAADGFTVGGMAKGAAMLAPDLATMLAVLTTDAEATPEELGDALRHGVADSFNALLVDGATSTNDTVLLLASGRRGRVDGAALADAVAAACADLAAQMAGRRRGGDQGRPPLGGRCPLRRRRPGPGPRPSPAPRCASARGTARTPTGVGLASELGSAGIAFDQRLVCIAYGDVTVAERGAPVDHDAEAVAAHMAGRHLHITCDLGIGAGRASVLTNDLTHAYVDENMGTS